MLYIVSTPIGNLKDITLRAIEVLKSVDLVACEDTRHSRILLDEYGIATPTTSYYQHNRLIKGEYLLSLLKEGKDVALISDAGTPGILDPGYNLINTALSNNIPITAIPGPVAFIDALVLSGKPAHRFLFEGFLSNKKSSRAKRLGELKELDCTVIFYESCHRILSTLEDVARIYGETEVVIARELTKKFEEVRRGKAVELIAHFQTHPPKGEFVVII
jgi:16S rRNA (cytidine1402-2'-O)-methyltransferase